MELSYEITAVPIPREDNPIRSPAAALAARLRPGHSLQFRLHRDKDRVRCFLSSDMGLDLALAVRSLPAAGFSLAPARIPPCPQTRILLGRNFRQRILTAENKPIQRLYLPAALPPDPKRSNALMEALYAMPAGCGLHFSIRRIDELSDSTLLGLQRMQTEDSIIQKILFSEVLYQVTGCLYGDPTAQKALLPEILYAFPGLCSYETEPLTVGDSILGMCSCQILPENFRELTCIILPEELEVLTDPNGSAGRRGLPLNKDTLFGMPFLPVVKDEKRLVLGANSQNQPVEMPLKDLCKHVLISAPPGAGKGNMIVNIALQLHQHKIPFLILESQKSECHHLRKKIPDLQVWKPENNQFVFNPFSLPGDISKKEYHPFLKAMLTEAFDTEGPLEQLYEKALNLVYSLHGYTDDSTAGSSQIAPFGLNEFITVFSQLLDTSGYSPKTQSDVKTGGLTRLQTLFNQNRAVFDSVRTIDPQLLLTGENVLQLNCLTADARQVFASLLLLQISALFRLRGSTAAPGQIRLVILVDEAHALLQSNLLNPQQTGSLFVSEYDNLLKTLRSLGIGIITISQTCEGIPRCITDGCGTKLFLGSSPYSGMETYHSILHADDTALNHLYLLHPGEGVYCCTALPSGVYFRTPHYLKELNLQEQYPTRNRFVEEHPDYTLHVFAECATCPGRSCCSHHIKTEARRHADTLSCLFATNFNAENSQKTPNRLLLKICEITDNIPLRWCILTQLARELNRQSPDTLNLKTLTDQLRDLWKQEGE